VQQGIRIRHADLSRPGRQPQQPAQPGGYLADPAARVSVDSGVADLKGKLFPDQAIQQLLRWLRGQGADVPVPAAKQRVLQFRVREYRAQMLLRRANLVQVRLALNLRARSVLGRRLLRIEDPLPKSPDGLLYGADDSQDLSLKLTPV
jgi:hypothetical protein